MSELKTVPSDRVEEASLLWDEYKYRHDLIWRHLIRSTLAVVALITVSYSTSIEGSKYLFIIAALLAVFYTTFSLWILKSELDVYEKIKVQYRKHQRIVHKLYKDIPDEDLKGGFSRKVYVYLLVLLILAIGAAVVHMEIL